MSSFRDKVFDGQNGGGGDDDDDDDSGAAATVPRAAWTFLLVGTLALQALTETSWLHLP